MSALLEEIKERQAGVIFVETKIIRVFPLCYCSIHNHSIYICSPKLHDKYLLLYTSKGDLYFYPGGFRERNNENPVFQ